MTDLIVLCRRCGEAPRAAAFLATCDPCSRVEARERSDAHQSVWTDVCAAGAILAPGGCPVRVPWAGAYCPDHSDAFYGWLNTPLSDIPDSAVVKRETRERRLAADPEAKRRMAEAIAWVEAYSGSWGLPLDLKADPRWGTKHMRLTDRQVEVILQARDRDAARAQASAQDPAQVEVKAFLESLTSEELLADVQRGFTFLVDMAAQARAGRPFSERQVEAINRCRARRQPRQASPQVTEIGLYRADDGTVYKVQAARQSGHLYAKRLVVIEHGQASFEFEQGAIRKLRPEQRMTVEQAAAFGHQFGVCAVCGATLTDPVSVERGIGPICASRV